MKWNNAISAAVTSLVVMAVVASATLWAAEIGCPRSTLPATDEALVEKTLHAMGGAEEIVFVELAIYRDGHFYRNFGGDSVNPNLIVDRWPPRYRLTPFPYAAIL